MIEGTREGLEKALPLLEYLARETMENEPWDGREEFVEYVDKLVSEIKEVLNEGSRDG